MFLFELCLVSDVSMQLKVTSQEYSVSMADNTSREFKFFEAGFCQQVRVNFVYFPITKQNRKQFHAHTIHLYSHTHTHSPSTLQCEERKGEVREGEELGNSFNMSRIP